MREKLKTHSILELFATLRSIIYINTLRTGDADLRF